MKKFLSLLFLSLALGSTAQEEGILRLYIAPAPESITIDGEVLEYGNTIALEPGEHRIKAWYPHKTLLDTSVEIKSGEIHKFFYHLKNSEAYNQYEAELKAYNKERHKHFSLPATTTLLVGGALAFTYFKGRQIEQEVWDKHTAYKYAGHDIGAERAQFEEARDRYRKYYYAQYVEYAALAVSSYFLIKGIRWLQKNPGPTIEDDKNPMTLNQIGFAPNRGPSGGYSIGIRLNLN